MDKCKLSIVVPAYNVELYVERCLKSILNQDNSDWGYEIIVINDGSTDRTGAIIESFKDEKVKIVNQNNQGLSCARNAGLKIASGKYVWFVDSDDWITEDAVSFISVATEKGPDIVALNYIECYEKSEVSKIVSYKHMPSCGIDLLWFGHNYPSQFYIYKKTFLVENSLWFYQGIYHEDIEFTPRAIFLAKDVEYIEKPLYNYFVRSHSITTTVNPKRAFDYLLISERLIEFDELHNREAHNKFMLIVCRVICNAFLIIIQSPNSEKKRFTDYMMKHNDLYRILFFSGKLKYSIRGILLRLSGKYCVSTYEFLMNFIK